MRIQGIFVETSAAGGGVVGATTRAVNDGVPILLLDGSQTKILFVKKLMCFILLLRMDIPPHLFQYVC